MKKFILAVSTILITLSSLFAKEQSNSNLVINLQDGSLKTIPLSSINKITFSGSNLLMNFSTSPLENYSLTTIKNLIFKDPLSGIENPKTYNKIVLYPTIADKYINLSNLPESGTIVTIFRQDGLTLFRLSSKEIKQQIEVSHLSSGVYFICANNQVLKFIKR